MSSVKISEALHYYVNIALLQSLEKVTVLLLNNFEQL